jgi:hypothetical protein
MGFQSICKTKIKIKVMKIYKFQPNYRKEKVKVKCNLKCRWFRGFLDMQTKSFSCNPNYQKKDHVEPWDQLLY